jgi:hypothetical protein
LHERKDRAIDRDESLLRVISTPLKKEEQEAEDMTLEGLLALADEKGLMRLGLGLMEAIAKAEGRALWH